MSKGIMFIEPLFHKVIDGTKTQTRRIVSGQNGDETTMYRRYLEDNKNIKYVQFSLVKKRIKPRFKVGEKAYLKEPYFVNPPKFDNYVLYRYNHCWTQGEENNIKWNNKLFMPEKYARYFIEITGVRCERLQDISDEDCFAEGVMESDQKGVYYSTVVQYSGARSGICKPFDSPQEAYAAIINKINGKSCWERNPYVWCYSFCLTNN